MTVAATDFEYISTLVDEHAAIVLRPEKNYLVESRLTPLVQDLGLGSIEKLVVTLRANKDRTLVSKVVDAMTTNETSWFRDKHPFDALRNKIVPQMLKNNASSRTLRIWSAAASTGQELYSIAMLLDSEFPELANWSVDLFGSDLSPTVLEQARKGDYSTLEVNRGLPAQMLVRYFTRQGRMFRINQSLRDRTHFEAVNLIGQWPHRPPYDVIFLRNVLIYFDIDVKRRIIDRMHSSLRDGGFLVLGSSETTLGMATGFKATPVSGSIIYQKEAR